jgi:hypothetical protein
VPSLRIPLLVTAILVGALATVPGQASAGLTITPPGTGFTGTLTGSLVFTVGGGSTVCTSSSFSGTTPALGPSLSLGGATLASCTTSGGNSVSQVLTTATATCRWTLTAGSVTASGFSAALTMPGGKQADGTQCTSLNVTLFGVTVCSYTFSTATIPVTYSNATTSITTDGANTVPFTTSGGMCGGAGNGTLHAQYSIVPNTFQVTNT